MVLAACGSDEDDASSTDRSGDDTATEQSEDAPDGAVVDDESTTTTALNADEAAIWEMAAPGGSASSGSTRRRATTAPSPTTGAAPAPTQGGGGGGGGGGGTTAPAPWLPPVPSPLTGSAQAYLEVVAAGMTDARASAPETRAWLQDMLDRFVSFSLVDPKYDDGTEVFAYAAFLESAPGEHLRIFMYYADHNSENAAVRPIVFDEAGISWLGFTVQDTEAPAGALEWFGLYPGRTVESRQSKPLG